MQNGGVKHHDLPMILNFEIDDETGAKLDALAAREHRSRRQQATKLLLDALEMIESDILDEGTGGRGNQVPTTTDIIRGAVGAKQPQPEGRN